jgi:hypothetical protein
MKRSLLELYKTWCDPMFGVEEPEEREEGEEETEE